MNVAFVEQEMGAPGEGDQDGKVMMTKVEAIGLSEHRTCGCGRQLLSVASYRSVLSPLVCR